MVDEWNLGTAMEHHRYHKVYIKITKAERITGTVYFKHKYPTNPTVTLEDIVVTIAQWTLPQGMSNCNK